ncbi:hypothetical protein AWB94_31180 [Mycolicibacterium canariasense]|nr:hypothetical protein AWB94_31180 [Mycolicibacterium canariasense]
MVLPSPAWGDRRNGVPVDACIADTILALWAEGVETIGSCCGHNGVFGPPTVILNDGVDAEWVLGLLPRLDPSRGWVVKQWQLTTTFRVRDR